MNKLLPLTLWILVILFGGLAVYYNVVMAPANEAEVTSSGSNSTEHVGAAYADIPWEHFQDVPRFELTNQEGRPFDSAELKGRPMAISFFFASCPTICRDLNRQVSALREQLNDPELMFVTISVDPEKDSPDVLKRYAADFNATTQDWNFLTGPLYKVKQLGQNAFRVNVDPNEHTDNILLVDRWGRYRDRFKWDDPYDMKRFITVSNDVLAEQSPPFGKSFKTRNVLAGLDPPNIDAIAWIREFHLTDQDSRPFFSRDLIGKVWVGSFFFVACPGICIEQNQYLAGLQDRLKDSPISFVSISTNPTSDTPAKMKEYARKFNADLDRWTFLTGDATLIERIGPEFFRARSSGGHHSSLLFVVDRWGNVRGDFDWREPKAEIVMSELIDQLNDEMTPPAQFERVSVSKTPDPKSADQGH